MAALSRRLASSSRSSTCLRIDSRRTPARNTRRKPITARVSETETENESTTSNESCCSVSSSSGSADRK